MMLLTAKVFLATILAGFAVAVAVEFRYSFLEISFRLGGLVPNEGCGQ